MIGLRAPLTISSITPFSPVRARGDQGQHALAKRFTRREPALQRGPRVESGYPPRPPRGGRTTIGPPTARLSSTSTAIASTHECTQWLRKPLDRRMRCYPVAHQVQNATPKVIPEDDSEGCRRSHSRALFRECCPCPRGHA